MKVFTAIIALIIVNISVSIFHGKIDIFFDLLVFPSFLILLGLSLLLLGRTMGKDIWFYADSSWRSHLYSNYFCGSR